MRNNIYTFLLFIILSCQLSAQTRITFIGNSITYGSGVANREKNSFPAQLQFMLGKDYIVSNFGVSGARVVQNKFRPYTSTYEYKEALKSKPDLVFIKLGTNDSKPTDYESLDDFSKDYKRIVQEFKELETSPRIVLLLPTPSFLKDSTHQSDDILVKDIVPRIQQVAYQLDCEVIDLHSLLIDKPDLFPDQLHPSSLGAREIARRLYEVIIKPSTSTLDFVDENCSSISHTNFYGYNEINFQYNNRNCKVVVPHKATGNHSWVWRARFWGHEPQTDIALLERGFYIVYCDVAEMFGNTKSIEIWNQFYAFLTQKGFSKQVVLEGMSRGGMYIYNWAIENPDKVACIYADAPVLDMRSWPGGKFKGKGSKEDWELYKTAYGLKSDKEAERYKGNPIFQAKKIVKGGYPILHVVGEKDELVPVDENTNVLEKEIIKLGGKINIIRKADVGHHPHSLPNPSPIVNFILESTNQKMNFATHSTPGVEYRSAAGWLNWADWWDNLYDIQHTMDTCKNADILFIGNSITQGLSKRGVVVYNPGTETFSKSLSNYSWVAAGIAGDRVENIIWRLQNQDYSTINPRYIVLTIGVNNMFDDSSNEIFEGIKLAVETIRLKLPHSKLILLGPLPCGAPKSSMREKYNQIHKMLPSIHDGKFIFYNNLGSVFISSNGTLQSEYVSTDNIHLLSSGYEVWAENIIEIINNIESSR